MTIDFQTWRERVVRATFFLGALAWSFELTSFLHAKEAVFAGGLLALAALGVCAGTGIGQAVRAYLPLWLWLAYAVIAALAFRIAYVPGFAVQDGIRFTTWLLVATLAWDLTQTKPFRERILDTMLAAGVGVALLGIGQYTGVLLGVFPEFPGYAQRVYSVFGNQDLFGGFLAMMAPLALRRMYAGNGRGIHGAAALAVLCAGLLLSGSRSAWLAAAVGGCCALPDTRARWEMLARRMALPVVACVLTLCCVWPMPFDRIERSFSSGDVGGRARVWFWDGAARMAVEAPATGVGLGNYPYWSPKYQGVAARNYPHFHNEIHTEHAHCEPLECLAETGVIGAAFFLWMGVKTGRRKSAALPVLAAFAVFSCFNAAAHSAPHAMAALLCCGMQCRAENQRKERESWEKNRHPLSTLLSIRSIGSIRSLLAPRRAHEHAAAVPRKAPSPLLAVLAALALLAATLACTTIPSFRLRQAEAVYLSGEDALPWFRWTLAWPWHDPAANEGYGMALLDAGRPEAALKQFRAAMAGLDTGRLYGLIARAARETGNAALENAARAALLERWPWRNEGE